MNSFYFDLKYFAPIHFPILYSRAELQVEIRQVGVNSRALKVRPNMNPKVTCKNNYKYKNNNNAVQSLILT